MKINGLISLLAIAGMFQAVSACSAKNALLSVRDAAVDQAAPLAGSGAGGIAAGGIAAGGTAAGGTVAGGTAGSGGGGGAGATGTRVDAAVLGTGDAGASSGTPKGFLIVNATANTVYVDLGDPVKCRAQDASGWQACEFFEMWCLPRCQYIQPGDQCCEQCEQETPTLLAVPAGGNRTVAWTGSLFAGRTGYCSDCQCQEQSPVGQGAFEATVRAYTRYSCVWGQPCPEKPDGTIPYAAPLGTFEEYAVRFAVPSASEMVMVTIPEKASVPDAATIDAGLCGNGWLDPGEQCDDGNTLSGDGCSSQCQIECNWMCGVGPGCPPCGISLHVCGNGIQTSDEDCDDGNVQSGDGCSATCQVEPGWRCVVPGRACVPLCGDGLMVGWETCDDGNTVSGDGCAYNCLVEPCWSCSSLVCVHQPCGDGGQDASEAGLIRCGDGVVMAGEECDCGDGTVPVPTACPGPNNDTTYGGCTTRCTYGPFCGDGQVNGPEEECDLGKRNGSDLGPGGCTFGCTKPHYCGDGMIDQSLGEECDLGALNGVKLDSKMAPSDAGIVYCDVNCRIAINPT